MNLSLRDDIKTFVRKQPDATRYRREPALSKKLIAERALRHMAELREIDAAIVEAAVQTYLEEFNYGT